MIHPPAVHAWRSPRRCSDEAQKWTHQQQSPEQRSALNDSGLAGTDWRESDSLLLHGSPDVSAPGNAHAASIAVVDAAARAAADEAVAAAVVAAAVVADAVVAAAAVAVAAAAAASVW